MGGWPNKRSPMKAQGTEAWGVPGDDAPCDTTVTTGPADPDLRSRCKSHTVTRLLPGVSALPPD